MAKNPHLILLCFFLSCIYYILKALKDVLIITAPQAGAETLPFLKAWVLFPASIISASIFIYLSKRFNLTTILKVAVSLYLVFFSFFTFYLYPHQDSFHLHSFANALQNSLPSGWIGFAALFRYWIFSLYFVLAELWGSMVYCVLFFALLNEMCTVDRAKTLYPELLLAGNLSALVIGGVGVWISQESALQLFPWGNSPWEQTLITETLLILLCGTLSLLCIRSNTPITTSSFETSNVPIIPVILKNRSLVFIALLVTCFNFTLHLSDVFWKDQIGHLYPNPHDFSSYMNQVTIWIGVLSTIFTLLFCFSSFQYLGWKWTAFLSPVLIFFGGALFFLNIPLFATTFICLLRSCKYSIYDLTKEFAYIPLNSKEKLFGKGAIDGVFSRAGKEGASLFFQVLLLLLPSIAACMPFVAALFFLSLFLIILCIHFLSQNLALDKAVC